MKSIALFIALVVTIFIYSWGAFTPQTQGITNTDTTFGLVVLSDTDLAQKVGGQWEGRRKTIKKAGKLTDCGGGGGNCMSKDDCLLNRKISDRAKYKCADCPSSIWGIFIGKYERVLVASRVVSWCSWNFETETCDRKTAKKGPLHWSCDNFLEMCRKIT